MTAEGTASDETDALSEATAGADIGDDGEWQTADQVGCIQHSLRACDERCLIVVNPMKIDKFIV